MHVEYSNLRHHRLEFAHLGKVHAVQLKVQILEGCMPQIRGVVVHVSIFSVPTLIVYKGEGRGIGLMPSFHQ